MGRSIKQLLGAGLLALLVTPAIVAQNPPPSPPAGKPPAGKPATPAPEEVPKLAAELVQLDAVITDKAGKAVTGLKKEDFEIIEDGQPQALSFFTAEIRKAINDLEALDLKRPSQSLDKLATSTGLESGRVILVVFDNLHMDTANFLRARQVLLRFVDDDVLDGDRVAILTTGGGLGMVQQLTDDKNVMRTAINRMSPRFGLEDNERPRITEYHARLIEQGDRDALDAAIQVTIVEAGLQGMPNAYELARGIVEGRVRRLIAESGQVAANTLFTLRNVIMAMRDIKGRKLALFVSDGFPITTAGASDARTRMLDVVDAATRAGVVIYSLDTRGLYAVVPGGDASQPGVVDPTGRFDRILRDGMEASKDVLNALARDTGGFPIFNTNDLQFGLKRTLEDNSAYYLLAYYPTNTKADGRFREVKVQVRGRPDLKVRTRKGYYGPGRKEAEVADKKRGGKEAPTVAPDADAKGDEDVRRSLSSPVPARDIGLNMALNFVDVPKKGPVTVMDLVVDGKNLQFNKVDVAQLKQQRQAAQQATQPVANSEVGAEAKPPRQDERYAAQLDLYLMAFATDGKLAQQFKKSVTMYLREQTHDFVVDNGLSYHDALPLTPGMYQVRLAARQRETGLIGTASGWIEVPDLNAKKLTLSSIFLQASPPDEFEEEEDADAAKEKEKKEKEGEQTYFRNQANRLIPEGSNLELFTVIYNAQAAAGKADLVVQTQIFRDNVVVYSSPLRPIAEDARELSRIPYGVRLSLKDLSPGRYVLQFTAIDRVGKTNAVRRVNFEIEE